MLCILLLFIAVSDAFDSIESRLEQSWNVNVNP